MKQSQLTQPLFRQPLLGAWLPLTALTVLVGVSLTAGLPVLSCSTSGCVQIAQAGSNRPLLKLGSQGADVSELQATLKLLGYFSGNVDGIYGEATANAVTAFQRAANLEGDGIVGVATWNRLFPSTAAPASSPIAAQPPTPRPTSRPATPTPRPATPSASSGGPTQPTPAAQPRTQVSLPVLKLGVRGAAVTALQERLKTMGYFKGAVDGVFGGETQNAVKAAQRSYQLDPDGVVGASTWTALLRSR